MLPALLLAGLPASLPSLAPVPQDAAEPAPLREAYIYDPQIQQFVLDQGIELLEAGGATPNEVLQEQLATRRVVDLPAPEPGRLTRKARGLYDRACAATIVLANLVPTEDEGEEGWVVGNAGTGFLVSEDGLAFTNYHVMMQEESDTYVAMTRDGRVLPVVEVLGGLREHDLALIRLGDPEGRPFPFLPIARDADVGERVHVVGHPGHQFWRYSSGEIARFLGAQVLTNGPVVPRIDVTAEFALGSSGGPIMNDDGQVVGVVAATHAMYDPSAGDRAGFQLVFRYAVPYETLLGMFVGAPAEAPAEEGGEANEEASDDASEDAAEGGADGEGEPAGSGV
jgi:S1-C subfamily serine protease